MKRSTSATIRRVGIVTAGILFVSSLGFSTLRSADNSSFSIGLACLLFGLSYVPWWANPCLFFTWCLLCEEKPAWATATAAVSTTLMLTALTIGQVPVNEAGILAPVIGYGLGFYLWLGCSLVLLATSIFYLVKGERSVSRVTSLQAE